MTDDGHSIIPFDENVGSSHVATGTLGLNLRPLQAVAGSPAADCLMLGYSRFSQGHSSPMPLVRVDALRPLARQSTLR